MKKQSKGKENICRYCKHWEMMIPRRGCCSSRKAVTRTVATDEPFEYYLQTRDDFGCIFFEKKAPSK